MTFGSTIAIWRHNARKTGKARQGYRKLVASYRQWEIMKSHLNRLILHQRIELSSIWAKELQQYAEEVVSLARGGTLYHQGLADSMLKSPEAREILYEHLVPRYIGRDGLVTRLVSKWEFRERDTTPLSYIEFIDRPGELLPAQPKQSEMIADLKLQAADSRLARRKLKALVR